MRSFLVVLLAAAFGAAGLFLLVCGFLTEWDGVAASVTPTTREDSATRRVLVLHDDGATSRHDWPSDVVARLSLPVDALGLAPIPVPDGLQETTKRRFTLHFLVEGPDGTSEVVPTTSPRSLLVALVAFVVIVGLRNMIVGGAPWALEPRKALLPETQAASGQPPPPAAPRPRKEPPPPRRRVGRGRR